MRVTIQRVSEAKVVVEGNTTGEITNGLLLLVGFEEADENADLEWIANKICNLRIFGDENGVMNLSVKDVKGQILLVSQFTLHASTKKGNRPSYIRSAKPDISIPLYESFKSILQNSIETEIQCGIFGADMKVHLVNDGPVTINIDSKNRE